MRRRSMRMRLQYNKRKRFCTIHAARRRREATVETRVNAQGETYRKGQLDRLVIKSCYQAQQEDQ